MEHSINLTREVAASPADVYRAFTNSAARREWLSDGAELDARVGGHMFIWWNDGNAVTGWYSMLEPDQKIGFSWRDQDGRDAMQVLITLAGQGDKTQITIDHTGIQGEEGDDLEGRIRVLSGGWEYGLEVLQSVLEMGEDIRTTRRPMMGISGMEEITHETSAKEGLAVTHGIRIDGTVTGMGAERAGLQKGDIITRMDGQEIRGGGALMGVLQRRRAGDTIEVEFYRGNEQCVAPMELSKRPIPDVPADPQELARRVEALYAEVNGELDKIVDGVGEEQASHHPAEGEWSAKETVAHLINNERDGHNWLASMIWGQELNVQADNETTRVKAMVAGYGTLEALLEELKRNQAVSVAMLANLPPEFVARRGSYTRVGIGALTGVHVSDHLEQIRAAIASAG